MANILRQLPGTNGKLIVTPRVMFGQERILYLRGMINEATMEISPSGPSVSSDDICDALLLLDKEGSDPIKMVINSPGGSVELGFNIIDTMMGLRSPVWPLVRQSASLASLIAICGAKGHRYILPSATFHLHGISWGASGKDQDVEARAKYVDVLRRRLLDILIERTDLVTKVKDIKGMIAANLEESNSTDDGGKRRKPSKEEIIRDALNSWLNIERFFTADEALNYGLADRVVTPEIQKEFFNIPKK